MTWVISCASAITTDSFLSNSMLGVKFSNPSLFVSDSSHLTSTLSPSQDLGGFHVRARLHVFEGFSGRLRGFRGE